MALASAAGSFGGTSRAFKPWVTTLSMPETAYGTTGAPAAQASGENDEWIRLVT